VREDSPTPSKGGFKKGNKYARKSRTPLRSGTLPHWWAKYKEYTTCLLLRGPTHFLRAQKEPTFGEGKAGRGRSMDGVVSSMLTECSYKIDRKGTLKKNNRFTGQHPPKAKRFARSEHRRKKMKGELFYKPFYV